MSFPIEFENEMIDLLGKDDSKRLFQSITLPSPISISVNRWKREKYRLMPNDNCIKGKVPWTSSGYYLTERPFFTFDPLLHAGYYYVQESSSMFISYIFEQLIDGPVKCLDACAAPGGKSLSLLNSFSADSILVANEFIRSRSKILKENLVKAGYPNVIVTNSDTQRFSNLRNYFDVILADVPCSGEGMFRKDAKAIEHWSPHNVETCVDRQRQIVSSLWPSLKEGGFLVYSTCTFNKKENEENVKWIIDEFDAESINLSVDHSWNIMPSLDSSLFAFRFMPYLLEGEGLFVSVLRKKKTEHSDKTDSFKSKLSSRSRIQKKESAYEEWTDKSSNDLLYIDDDKLINAVPQQLQSVLTDLHEYLNVVGAGVEIADAVRNIFIPRHELALSSILKEESFPHYELSYSEAISFLKKGNVRLPDRIPNSYVLVTYKNVPIGFLKNLGNRTNNLYPKNWRILSSRAASDEVNLFNR